MVKFLHLTGTSVISLKVEGTNIEDSFTLTVIKNQAPNTENFNYATIEGGTGSGNIDFYGQWSKFVISLTDISTELPTFGSGKALKYEMTDIDSWAGMIFMTQDLLPNTSYTLSFDFKVLEGNSATAYYINFNTLLDDVMATTPFESALLKSNLDTYGHFEYSITTPDVGTFDQISIKIFGGADIKETYVMDNFSFIPTQELAISNLPAYNILALGTEHTLSLIKSEALTGVQQWTSSNTNIATVNDAGLVTAVGVGDVIISISIENAGFNYTDSISLSVADGIVKIIDKINTMYIDGEYQLNVTSLGNFTETYTFEASETGIVNLSMTGEVLTIIPVAKGTVTITVTRENASDSFTVNVYEMYETFEQATIDGKTVTGSITTNAQGIVSITNDVNEVPEGGNGNALKVQMDKNTWQGVNFAGFTGLKANTQYTAEFYVKMLSGIATKFYGVNIEYRNNGIREAANDQFKILTFDSVGSTTHFVFDFTTHDIEFDTITIRFFIDNTTETDFILIFDSIEIHEPRSLEITNRPTNDIVVFEEGLEIQLACNMVNISGTPVWISDNEMVATIDATGKVSLVSAGLTEIRVSVSEGGRLHITSFMLEVKEPSIVIENKPTELYAESFIELTVTDYGILNGLLEATSSDINIATVTVEGNKITVTAIAEGNVTITVTKDGKSDFFELTVTPKLVVEEYFDNFEAAGTIEGTKYIGQNSTFNIDGVVSTTMDASSIPEGGSGTALVADFWDKGTTDNYPGITTTNIINIKRNTEYVLKGLIKLINSTDLTCNYYYNIDFYLGTVKVGTQAAVMSNLNVIGNTQTINTKFLTLDAEFDNIKIKFFAQRGATTKMSFDNFELYCAQPVFITNVPEYGMVEYTENGTYQLNATRIGQPGTVTWASSDESIATVDNTGLVTIITEGTVNITAGVSFKNLNYTDMISLKIKQPGLYIVNPIPESQINQTYTLKWFVLGGEIVGDITVLSSNPEVASIELIESNIIINTISIGTTTFTVTKGTSTINMNMQVVAADVNIEYFENAALNGVNVDGNMNIVNGQSSKIIFSLTEDPNELPILGSGTALKITKLSGDNWEGPHFRANNVVEGQTYNISFDYRELTGTGNVFYVNGGGSTITDTANKDAFGHVSAEFVMPAVTGGIFDIKFFTGTTGNAVIYVLDNIRIEPVL